MAGAGDDGAILSLGIDAAWTASAPSGVALVLATDRGRELLAVSGSYSDFARSAGLEGDSPLVIEACAALAGRRPDIVAVDMPLSREPIVSRRASDDAVSRLWGARKCGTHTPSASRPGAVGAALSALLEADGYPLATTLAEAPCVVEVYPHPALVELTGAAERVPYKAGKTGSYWRGEAPATRRARLFAVWRSIVAALDREVAGTADTLPVPVEGASGAVLKSFEDRLDAVVCAWVGCLALEGRATPYGDDRSAIWLPTPPLA
jgi:predicted RNase H-like nuclease